eukprot:scaffold2745_cov137-Skeletonema_menzelii.AAC.6
MCITSAIFRRKGKKEKTVPFPFSFLSFSREGGTGDAPQGKTDEINTNLLPSINHQSSISICTPLDDDGKELMDPSRVLTDASSSSISHIFSDQPKV